MNFKKRVNDSWVDTPNYIHNTSTDTITTLPATLYPTDATATAGLKGNTVQNGTPTPSNPVDVNGVGERTASIMDVYMASSGEIAIVSGLTFKFLEMPQCITVNGQSSSMYPQIQIWGENGALQLENGKTYTGLIKTTNKPEGSLVYMLIQACDVGGNWSTIKNILSDSVSTSFSVLEDYVNYRYVFVCQNSGITYDNMKVYLMLVEGSTPLETYEPYGYKIPISSADTTTNIYLGEVQTTRKIKKLVLTGEEYITYQPEYSHFFFTRPDAYYSGTVRTTPCDCSHYQSIYDGRAIEDIPNQSIYVTMAHETAFHIKTTDFTDATDFKSYLAAQYAAGTPVTVWYVLAIPETAVVNEPLRKIGDYADEVSGISIPTIAGANTISVDTTVQPSEITVNYEGWHPVQSVPIYPDSSWMPTS